jgi:RNA polymerase sigma-54 factor
MSDQHVADMLRNNGVVIARRTVAKYREEMSIPPQAQRKKSNS